MYNYYNKIVILGDNSKYLFLKSILKDKIYLSEDKLYKNNLKIIYSNNNYFEEYDELNIIEIGIDVIPFSKLILIPRNNFYFNNEEKEIDKLVVFNSFPYGKYDLINIYNEILINFKVFQSLFVLYKEERRFSKDDLASENDLIIKAKELYSNKNIESILYDSNSNVSSIFELNPNIISAFKKDYKNKIELAKENLKDNYNGDYEFYIKSYFNFITLLDEEEYRKFNSIFNFNNIKKTLTIWSSYVNNFEKKYLMNSNGLINEIRDLYMEFIKDITIMNYSIEIDNLYKYILNLFRDFFKEEIVLYVPKTELEYIKLINYNEKDNIQVLFRKKLDEFIDFKLKIELFKYIKDKINYISKEVEG